MKTLLSRRLPKKIRFDAAVARRIVPQRLIAQGWVPEEAKRAVELVIKSAEGEAAGARD